MVSAARDRSNPDWIELRTQMGQVKARTISLLYRWVRRREARMSPRGAWPDTDYLFVQQGIAYCKVPVQLSLIRSTSPPREPDEVDVFGQAFWSLEDWKCGILWVWATTDATQTGLDSWIRFQRSIKLSEAKLNSILLDLQDAARARGIV